MENRDKPAFPIHPELAPNFAEHDYAGISKREYFAAMALQGLLTNPHTIPNKEGYEYASSLAVKSADALLDQLEKSR